MEATELERRLSELECEVSMEVIDRDCGQRIGGGMEGRIDYAAATREFLEWVTNKPNKIRHYGIWSDKIGRWWWRYMKVFVTTSKAVAKAQLTMIFAGTEVSSPQEDLEPWRVRCIEEWADAE